MKLSDRLGDLAQKLIGAKDALRGLHAVEQELRAAHAQTLAERLDLLQARPARADVDSGIVEVVARRGQDWGARHGDALVRALGGSLDISMDHRSVTPVPPRFPAEFDSGYLDVGAFCAIAPDVVVAGLKRIVAGHSYVEGPRITERPGLVADLDKKIARIEAEHTALVDSAAALSPPIQIKPLEPVENRRRAEKIKADNAAQIAAIEATRRRRS